MVEFDSEIKHPQFQQFLNGNILDIPVRELLLRSLVCRSVIELVQKNFNFGLVEKNERRTKTIVIKNNSETPALYAIRKSGSIASGDILLEEGKLGVIRGYGRKEVSFVFEPSLSDSFVERLVVENVLDLENNQILTIKAKVQKPANFFLQTSFLNFGMCLLGEAGQPQEIILCNTSHKQARQFEVRVNNGDIVSNSLWELEFWFESEEWEEFGVDDKSSNHNKKRRPMLLLSDEVEEQIEQAEQKLKIAERKGQQDKIKKIRSKLEKMRSGIADSNLDASLDESSVTNTIPEPENSENATQSTLLNKAFENVVKVKRCCNSILVTVEPREIKKISVSIITKRLSKTDTNPFDSGDESSVSKGFFSRMEVVTGRIYVNEIKNTDVTKKVSTFLYSQNALTQG